MKKTESELLALAHKQFRTLRDLDFERDQYFVARMKFAFNIEEGHWITDDRAARVKYGRPCLTSNQLSKFVAQVVNQERTEVNFGDVIPVDDISDPAGAKIRNALIEDIEYQSNVEEIYATSGEHAVGGGFGYWRIVSEFNQGSYDQELKIKPCENPLNVHVDPRKMYAFITELIPDEEFIEEYGEDINRSDFEGDNDYSLWYEPDKVRIAEWFLKEPYKCVIAEIFNPMTDEIGVVEITKENEREIRGNYKILRERVDKAYRVIWRKITGDKVLDTKEWPGKDIPIIEVVGHQIKLQGKTYKLSLTHDAEDANRMLDYVLTAAVEKWQLSPKAPYLTTPTQTKGFETEWATANITNTINLPYNWDPQAGKPTREMPPPIDTAAMQFLLFFGNAIKDILGMDESSLGMRSNERSGKAIMARNARTDIITYAFPDNLKRAKAETKKQLLDLIPKVYDNARIIRLKGKNEIVQINFPILDSNSQETKVNDLSKGRYDFRVKQNTSASRRQQIVDYMTSMLQYAPPQYADILLKLAAKYSDLEGAEEFMAEIEQRTQQLQAMGTVPGENPPQGGSGMPVPGAPPNIV